VRERSLVARFAAAGTLAAAAFGPGAAVDVARADDLGRLNKPALEKEKLREEIRTLRKKRTEAWWERPETIPVAAALVAFLTGVGAFVNQTREYGRQKNRDREVAEARDKAFAHRKDVDREAATARDDAFAHQQEEDRAQRTAERQRRYDELFATTSANLASENEALRLAAAASIEAAFLPDAASGEGRDRLAYRAQVFTLLVNVLTLPDRRPSDRVLARGLAKALRSQLPILGTRDIEPAPGELELDGAFLGGPISPASICAESRSRALTSAAPTSAAPPSLRANFETRRCATLVGAEQRRET
jgi:hypothetical protein